MKFFNKILSFIFPNRCICCQKSISCDGIYCANCWHKLEFIGQNICHKCAHPFEIDLEDCQNVICLKCHHKKFFFDKTIVIYRYNATIAQAIANFKYRDQTFLAKKFAEILINAIANEIKSADIICAVPLHAKKLYARKFNQSLLIAKFLAAEKLCCDLLIRAKNQKPQVRLTFKQRLKNVRSSFVVNAKYHEIIKGKKIILIDDVITTGATVNACAKKLKRCQVAEVVVIAIAKAI